MQSIYLKLQVQAIGWNTSIHTITLFENILSTKSLRSSLLDQRITMQTFLQRIYLTKLSINITGRFQDTTKSSNDSKTVRVLEYVSYHSRYWDICLLKMWNIQIMWAKICAQSNHKKVTRKMRKLLVFWKITVMTVNENYQWQIYVDWQQTCNN